MGNVDLIVLSMKRLFLIDVHVLLVHSFLLFVTVCITLAGWVLQSGTQH